MFTMRNCSIILLATVFFFWTIDPSMSGLTGQQNTDNPGSVNKFNRVSFPNAWPNQINQNPVTDYTKDKDKQGGVFSQGYMWPAQKSDNKDDDSDNDDSDQGNPYNNGITQKKGNLFGGLQLGTFGRTQKPSKDDYGNDSSSDDDDDSDGAQRRDARYNDEAAIRASMNG
ncbi:uncharacterized protein LOC135840230 [Planococcus citri]|uniref:uncharacterized protein LOC135840230 n=1 Tax=Planococcus citri TaxID=170843 RepID=UPI0031F7C128